MIIEPWLKRQALFKHRLRRGFNTGNVVILVLPPVAMVLFAGQIVWGQPMATRTSRLTRKYQATIPEPVRKLLNLEAGDAVAFDITDHTVQLRKAQPVDLAFAQGVEESLGEWDSAEDEDAYGDL